MAMKLSLSAVSGGLALSVSLLACSQPSKVAETQGLESLESAKPNVLFILVDDLGWRDLGVYGSAAYQTPNIDQLAQNAVLFTSAYSPSPVCSSSRAALMTGKDVARLQITNWIPGDNPQDRMLLEPKIRGQLPLSETSMAEAFKALGYKTFFAGKWHLGSQGHFPEDQGFDVNIAGQKFGRPVGGYYSPYKNSRLVDGPVGEYLTDRLTSETIDFIEQNQSEPFFAFLSYYTVHTPLQASERHLTKAEQKIAALVGDQNDAEQKAEHGGFTKQRQNNAVYASMVAAMDENVGRLLKRLKNLGLDENTIIVFTSDNGGRSTLYGAGDATSNLPLRAGKGWVYEGGIRVPLIIQHPSKSQAGKVSDEPVVGTDLLPTLLELVGTAPQNSSSLDGISIAPIITGQGSIEREALYFYYPHYHGSASLPSAAVRMGKWKLVKFFEDDRTELYDLENDIGEQTDLSSSNPKLVVRMDKMWEQWFVSVDASELKMNPNYVSGQEKINFAGAPKK